MKTTVEISDSLLDEIRRLAAIRSATLRELIEEGLRKVLSEEQPESFHLRDGSFGQGGLLREMTWEEIRDEAYQGRGA
jgi:hypothetical protein